ncbi:FliA/WhiG family RNA polymerase sigma factor [Bowmanella pacifica]|uniref:RNA polymerase sigma factor for flagellar operon n=1 Tax=Bowmanella pacifica TaxID=502051 RepID=A0A917YX43_9ALTE|nr:FliA/WhiG family RNA polymerase sigma factor [Bowmanella pacifica]GGO69355.1 RNA polymerase sigma factor for flagellar operon [Bowmanella pacifica]
MLATDVWTTSHEQPSQRSVAGESSLLNRYGHLIKRAAAHMRTQVGVVVDRDDLQQIGMMALLGAIRRYGRDVDEHFESYAFKSVRGAMLDEFRRVDWRPRQLRQQAHKLRDQVRALRRTLGREPSDNEICSAMQIDASQLLELQYVEQAEAVDSLEQLMEQGGPLQADDVQVQAEVRLSLQKALAALPARNKLLLHLYYTHELNMKEIALTLQLTESRVCQLHKQSVEMLTRRLQS